MTARVNLAVAGALVAATAGAVGYAPEEVSATAGGTTNCSPAGQCISANAGQPYGSTYMYWGWRAFNQGLTDLSSQYMSNGAGTVEFNEGSARNQDFNQRSMCLYEFVADNGLVNRKNLAYAGTNWTQIDSSHRGQYYSVGPC